MKDYRKFIIFWLGQGVSQLGTAMTGFALVLWLYGQNHSAMSVSLMSFCRYVPYVLASLFAGTFVDRHDKKAIMLAADSVAAVCTVLVFVLSYLNRLSVWNIYLVNTVSGFMNAFQQPASSIAVGKIVPKEKLSNASGMNSFSSTLVMVMSPVIASFVYSVGGLKAVLFIDLATFLFAFFTLLLFIHIPDAAGTFCKKSVFSGINDGFLFLKKEKGLFYMILTIALINFFSRLTYENILPPMILARSGGQNMVLGVVNALMGVGGIVGGVFVSMKKRSKNNVRMIYFSAAVSFLFGDLLMAVGRNVVWWSAAGVAASLPIPFLMAGQNVVLYEKIPEEIQGRVFSVRNAIQFCTIPVGILLGGFLADYVFEPFMRAGGAFPELLGLAVGSGTGSGMAAMFLCTGVSGFAVSCFSYRNKEIRKLDGSFQQR